MGATVREAMVAEVRASQLAICRALEALEPEARFGTDSWRRPGGGGGLTRVLAGGEIFAKAGVNVSEVHGILSDEAAANMGGGDAPGGARGGPFFAAGLSLVLHPVSPMVPTVHANFRYFERYSGEGGEPAAWWFGGGADLTPCYLFEEDVAHFHQTLKEACDRHDPAFYPAFKAWCDRYFLIQHREETRGVGGIFFDALCDRSATDLLAFVADGLASFLPAYLPLVERRRRMAWGPRERAWQLQRRGRYAEFNLVYDRGTLFGLRTGGRIESILMSLPPEAAWAYDVQLPADGPEARLREVLRRPRAWVVGREDRATRPP